MARQLDEIHVEARTPRASAELFNEIIRPIANRLEGVARLVVVPDPTYENVRFAALWDSSRKQFLVEKFSIRMAPSASAHSQAGALANSETAALAPLVFAGHGQTSDREARNVAALYADAALRTGVQATSRAFFAEVPGRAVVHLAAPTVANAAFPFLSAFSVADEPGRRHSGNVLAHDIAARSLSTTRLVVIDEVATTNRNRGEGTLALARAFLAAGVPAVLGTLPGADELATRDLMVGFHRRIASRMTPAEALTDLQRNVLQQNGRRLGAWSALVLYGSDR
jgi:CHAT domain-containing protein